MHMLELLCSTVFLTVAAFLLGSVPFGLLVGKLFCGVDPREAGSGNVGATNVARLCGTGWGALTLACDLLKGFLPVYLLLVSDSDLSIFAFAFGMSVICGHVYSLFLRGRGGKGVATTVGVFLAVAPLQLTIAGVVCLFMIWRSGFVSIGSITLVALLPFLMIVSGLWNNIFLSFVIAGVVIYAHRGNIVRLLRNEEQPWMKQ